MDSKTIKNHVSPIAVKRMGLLYKQKQYLYLLVMISGDPILYKDGIIYIETGLIQIEVKSYKISVLFNVLLLGKDKAILKMSFLKEFNLRINWITNKVEIQDTKSQKV